MITFFYIKSNSINRSYSVLYEELSRRKDADFRLCDVSIASEADIKRLATSSGLVVIDNFVRVAGDLAPHNMNSVVVDGWRGKQFYDDVWGHITSAQCGLMYVASGWDLHWPGPDLDSLLPKLSALAWLYEKKPLELEELPFGLRDDWMSGHVSPMANWNKVRSSVPVRIELMHSLANDEFLERSKAPFWEGCVAGDVYRPRMIALNSARKERMRMAPFRGFDDAILRYTAKAAIVIGGEKASRLRNRLRQVNQHFLVSRSAINFVCGSGYRYPVRKFFEVPACRSLLMAYPCVGMEDYGYVDGVNCIYVAPDDFGREAKRLLRRSGDLGDIALRGHQWTRENHSVERRVDDLLECARRLVKGRLRYAAFRQGKFEIEG